jgi:hypothetical protein
MELQIGNVRSQISSMLLKVPREASKVATGDYVRIAMIVSGSILLGRAALFYAIFPCGIALITVLMNRGRANIYALPLILIGILSNYGTGYDIWGDAIAVFVCGAAFFVTSRMNPGIVLLSDRTVCICFRYLHDVRRGYPYSGAGLHF